MEYFHLAILVISGTDGRVGLHCRGAFPGTGFGAQWPRCPPVELPEARWRGVEEAPEILDEVFDVGEAAVQRDLHNAHVGAEQQPCRTLTPAVAQQLLKGHSELFLNVAAQMLEAHTQLGGKYRQALFHLRVAGCILRHLSQPCHTLFVKGLVKPQRRKSKLYAV